MITQKEAIHNKRKNNIQAAINDISEAVAKGSLPDATDIKKLLEQE